MQDHAEIVDLDADAARQYIDARSTYLELERAVEKAAQVRGGMLWKTVAGKQYLIRTSTRGAQKSLGPRSAETEHLFDAFTSRKRDAEERVKALREAMERHVRMNRALRVGRVPSIVIQLLQRVAAAGLDSHFRVVGTHSLFAYETAAGVRFGREATTTQDIDLLWDASRWMNFSKRLTASDKSMLGLLRKVDPTFRLMDDQKYTAINSKGFQVDILRREAMPGDPHPVRLSDDEDDFWVVQAKRAGELLAAPSFSEVIVAVDGSMARMTALHPRAFVDFKRWMAEQADRDPRKRARDRLQASVVDQVLRERLPQL